MLLERQPVQVKPFSQREVVPVMQMPSDWQSALAKPRLSSARGFLPGKQKLQGWRLEPVKPRPFYDRVSPVKRRPPGSRWGIQLEFALRQGKRRQKWLSAKAEHVW